MTGARRVRGSRRARAHPAATVPLLLAVFATCIAPAAVAVDVSTGAMLLAAVNDATEGEIKLKANITTPFEWTQVGVYIKRDLVIESDSAVCGDTGCWITGPTTTSRDFVRVDDGATVTMRKIHLDKHGDKVAPFTYEGGAIRVVNGTLIAEDCGFIDNAGNYGGAVDVKANGYATFERCTFNGNVAAYKKEDGEFILFIFVWAIGLTSCFVYSRVQSRRRRSVRGRRRRDGLRVPGESRDGRRGGSRERRVG